MITLAAAFPRVRSGGPAIIEQQLKLTAALADVPIESSCFCRQSPQAGGAW